MGCRFEIEGAGDAPWVALFHVERGWEPEVRLNVGAPAVQTVEPAVILFRASEVAVEADYVSVAGLDPDAPEEAASILFAGNGGHVEDCRGSVAEKVVSNVAKIVVLTIKTVRVHQEHLEQPTPM